MPFVTKDWRDSPGDLTTPITAAALENLETRTTAGIPYENVLWHGAVGTNTGDQTAAIQAAIDACEASGGTVYIPRGTYRLLGSLELHEHVSLLGEGPYASLLSWPTSLGAGTWALTPDLTSGAAEYTTISGLRFVGPGTWDGVTFGGAISNMNGVKIGARQTVENCSISYFHRGLGVLQDHLDVVNTTLTSNTYNLAFLAGDTTGGDHHFTSVGLTGATIASVYVENLTGIAGSLFSGCHLGLAPYGILSAPGRAGNDFIYGSTFIETPVEWFGTAAIWGANTTDKIARSRWINCGTSQDPAKLLPATTYEFLVRSGEISSSVFDMAFFRPAQEPGTAYFSTSGSGGQQLDRYEMVPTDILQTNTAAFLHRTAGGAPAFCKFVDEAGASGIFCWVDGVDTIPKGSLVKMSGANACTLYDNPALVDAPLGVALQTGAAGTIIAVATQGYTNLPVAGGTITGYGRFLKPSATTGRVVQATGWSDGPIVGVSMSSGTTGNAFEAHLRMGAWG